MTLQLFNTLGREIQEFKPRIPGEVGMYACGPTVYNFAHIGNLRAYIFEDILRRTLGYMGLRVRHVMNVTDVGHLTGDADEGEDKVLKSAREKGSSAWEIARFYTEAFFRDLEQLNVLPPTVACRATDHIGEMIHLIQRLEQGGFTYSSGGNIYFAIDRFPGYGELAGLDLEELKAGARIEVDGNKRNPHDFVLWFTRSKFEHQAMLWDSPWGRGYPGWHIECSAMALKYLGEQFDIHCGGVDHIRVHHTNEIAQIEAATGKRWVNYWLHGEFLVLAKEKMAKSAGSFLTLEDLKSRGCHPLDFRYLCLGAHYRSQLQFSLQALEAAKSARQNLVEKIEVIKEEARTGSEGKSRSPSQAQGYLDSFAKNLGDDLNAPRGLADLWGLVKEEGLDPGDKLAALLSMDEVLGLDLAGINKVELVLSETMEVLVRERERCRQAKDWKRADEIRRLLLDQGILLEDTPQGVRWKKV